MACITKITKDITNDCDNKPTGGLEGKMWAINRRDATFTLDATKKASCTAIALAVGTKAFVVTAVKKEMNVGADAVISDNVPGSYTHYFAIQPYSRTAADVQNMEDMSDIVIIAELKGKKTEGCFVIFGLETGLHLSSASFRANDNSGLSTYEFTTREGEGEQYSRYVFGSGTYATDLSSLVTLETEVATPP